MIVDINKYSINEKIVKKWYVEHGEGNPSAAVSILANSTMVPCIVIAYWIGDGFGWTHDVLTTIQRLKKFYGYTHILGLPESTPDEVRF